MMNPFKSKKGLGRGLSSLIGDNTEQNKKNNIPISSIVPNKFQPRKNFNKETLEELSQSIKQRGIIQPLIVRKSNDQNEKYELIAGERRWQAAQFAGLHEVPIIEIEADDLKSLEIAIVENVQRNDLNPVEEASSYKRLIEEFSYDQEDVSKFIGKSRSYISNSLRILSLPNDVLQMIEDNKLSFGHAKTLVGLENSSFLSKLVVKKKLSVRQTESLVKSIKKPVKKIHIIKDPNISNLETSIKDKIGINILINNNKDNSGKLTFNYKDLEQLERIISIIKSYY